MHPTLPSEGAGAETATIAAARIAEWLPRCSCIVVGPGLGRDATLLACAAEIITRAQDMDVPMVLDADAIWLLNEKPDLIKGYAKAVLTPNAAEYPRLAIALGLAADVDAGVLAAALGGVTVIRKGYVDDISNGRASARVTNFGSSRRCGGLGDVLAGSIATFMGWGSMGATSDDPIVWPVVAAYGGAVLARTASKWAYDQHRRSVVAGDVIRMIGPAFDEKFDSSSTNSGKQVGFVVDS